MISFDELVATAIKSRIHYLELQEFNKDLIHENIKIPKNTN